VQRHVLVLLVTFDLWVSLLVSVNPVFVFWIWLCFCFCWLAGPGLGCWAAPAPAALGGLPASPAPSASVPDPGPQRIRSGALPLSPLHSLGFACLCKAWDDPGAGQVKRGAIPEHPPPTASMPTASGHGWQICRDHRVTGCPQVSSFWPLVNTCGLWSLTPALFL